MSVRRSYWIALSAVIVLTALFRAPYLNNRMLWTDEYFSLMFTTGHLDDPIPPNQTVENAPDVIGLRDAKPIWELPRAMRADTHPPLFPIALRLWREVFGESELVARLFMLVCSLVGAGLLFDTVRRQVSISAGFLAGILYALSAPMVSYGVEIRNYGVMTTLVLAAVNVLVRIEINGFTIRRAILLGLLSLGAMLTHYFALAPIVALGLYALVRFPRRTRNRTIATLVIAMIAFAVFQSPSFFAQKNQFDTNLDWLIDRSGNPLQSTLLRSLLIPGRSLTFDGLVDQATIGVSIMVLVLITLRRSEPMLIHGMVAGAAIIQCAATDLLTSSATTNFIRYALPAVPAILALLAIAVTFKWTIQSRAVVALVGVLLIWANFQQLNSINLHRPKWHQAFKPMRDSQLNSSDTIAFIRHPANPWYTKILYASFCAEVGQPNSRVIILDDDKSISLDATSRLFIISDPTELRTDLSARRPLLWEGDRTSRGPTAVTVKAFGPIE